MAKRAVTASAINIETGLVKDVGLLERYVEDDPPDAVKLLETCIRIGSKKMRTAAFPLLAARDVKRAEQLALEHADIGEQSTKPKVRAEHFAFLGEVATSKCLDRAEALGVLPERLFAHQLARAVPWLKRQLVRQRATATAAQWLGEHARAFPYAEGKNPARDWFVSLLDAPETSDAERHALFEGLLASRIEAVLMRADVPADLVPAAAFGLPTRACYDRLVPHLDALPAADALATFAAANMMWEPADERWFVYWKRRLDGQPADARLAALRTLAEVSRVDRTAAIHSHIDRAVVDLLADMPWQASHASLLQSPGVWSHPAAADIVLKGVAESAATYNDHGHRTLAGRLRTLHDVGRAAHIPRLEQLAQHVASITNGSRAAAAWFGEAIAAIRSRTD
jgi:hypothetical protein